MMRKHSWVAAAPVIGLLAGCGGGIKTVTVTEGSNQSSAQAAGTDVEGGGGQTTTLTVPSGSMEPTLTVGQRIQVNESAYSRTEPAVGEVVVLHPPAGAESASECGTLVGKMQPLEMGEPCPTPVPEESNELFVKRIVAVGGDELSIKDGHPVVNGVEKTDEPYIKPCGGGYECNLPRTITIPKGYFFMLGDNRGESDDSRYWGPVPKEWIIGRVED